MNVVVVVIDALRASDVGCLGRKADTTPNIDELASESLVFERAFAQSNYTDVCMSNILSGKTPREHGVTHHGTAHTAENLERIKERSPRFLPEILNDNGYETIGVDWMGRWHEWGYDTYGVEGGGKGGDGGDQSLPDALFDRFTDAVLDLPDPVLAVLMKRYYRWLGYDDFRVDCEELTDVAIDRIGDADDPFFTLLHYWDVHPPYLPPDEHGSRFEYDGEDEPLDPYFGRDGKGPMSAEFQPYARGEHETMGDAKRAYDGAISWVDEQLGRLLDFLREEGVLEDTMVVVTADHGHNFGEHGIFSDNSGLFDTSLHVPLIVHDPTSEAERISGLVQHTDLVPTILDRVGIERPDDLRGNVLPETREYVFAETIEHRMRMIRMEDWKLVLPEDLEYLRGQSWYDGDGERELYDLRNDPRETTNVAAEHPDVADRLESKLEEEVAAQERIAENSQRRSADLEESDMDDIKSRLQALGYADDDNV